MPTYAALSKLRVHLNAFEVLSLVCARILLAWKKIKPTNTVVTIFRIVKAGRFVLTTPARNGLHSTAPKKRIPVTVVTQSNVPTRTMSSGGNALIACIFFPRFSSEHVVDVEGLREKLLNSTYSEVGYKIGKKHKPANLQFQEHRRQKLEVKETPVVIIETWTGKSDEQKAQIIHGIARVFEGVGVPADQLHIIIHDVPKANWGIRGEQASKL